MPSLSLLYYSKDDAATFAYLLKKNAEEAKKKGKRCQKVDHSLVELEGMVNYCIKSNCKRKYVLEHFGEEISESICKKTCDFCIDPAKVERAIQASHCMYDVINSHRLMRAGKDARENQGRKYHHDPLADDEGLADDHGLEEDNAGDDECLLGITDHVSGEDFTHPSTMTKQKGFVKASNVLSKYEAMEYETTECQLGKKGGFVNYKMRSFVPRQDDEPDAKRYMTVNIPEHLRCSMPDPLEAHKKTSGATTNGGLKSSSSYASESDRLRAEIEELRKQKDAAQGGISSRTSATILPVPSLSFKTKWR